VNIQQAMEQIRGAVTAYLSKDERGLYRIPFHMQRPIIMLGPPGVGKTAIVAQVARELGVNYVSYSITHHTRQTALGLPFIVEREYGGRTYQVSEYTMSEIIGAVHEARERSGIAEGILFLDEVNCVSETLAPAMLQFLQYKTFGQHRLPEGWVIVTAGNPPEYNRSARDFDPAMLDRLKRIEVEPDVGVWLNYASGNGVHPAVIGFLEARPESFYLVRAGVAGMRLVTARGWDDLSRMLLAYEAEGIGVDVELIGQYLQDEQTALDFSVHYELFCKYRDTYRVAEILAGGDCGDAVARAQAAAFGERVAVVGLLGQGVLSRVHAAVETEQALRLVRDDIVALKPALSGGDAAAAQAALEGLRASLRDEAMARAGSARGATDAVGARRAQVLADVSAAVAQAAATGDDAFERARASFNRECARQAALAEEAGAAMERAYAFLDEAFGAASQEAVIFTTRVSADTLAIRFVADYGSDAFLRHNKGLLVETRKRELLRELDELS